MADRRRISKLLSLILRHRPDEFGLNVDEYGFAPLSEVVEAVQQRYSEVTEEDVSGLVEGSRQHRFEIRDGNIRALYAHSFFVEMDGEPLDPPESMFMAVELETARKMKEEGMRPEDRFYLHLSKTREIAEERAEQLTAPSLIEIHAAKAKEQGLEFYERGEVVLTREIAADLLGEIIELEPSEKAGSRRRERGPRRDDSRRDGSRGDSSRRDESRRSESRGRREDRPRRREGRRDETPAPAPEPASTEPQEITYGRKPRRLAAGARR